MTERVRLSHGIEASSAGKLDRELSGIKEGFDREYSTRRRIAAWRSGVPVGDTSRSSTLTLPGEDFQAFWRIFR
jgi:hypothetical protein